MSEFVSKLEGYAELEVSIIRATKINKVLKAILKLPSIPKEEDFRFKPRSQSLLDKWNKLLASEQGTPAANGTSETKVEAGENKVPAVEATNGVHQPTAVEDKAEEKTDQAIAAQDTAIPDPKDSSVVPEDIPTKPTDEDVKVSK